jgi:hypothetical protein
MLVGMDIPKASLAGDRRGAAPATMAPARLFARREQARLGAGAGGRR